MNHDDKIDTLMSVITRAYWMIEVGDRIGALRELSRYAEKKNLADSEHWLMIKSKTSGDSA